MTEVEEVLRGLEERGFAVLRSSVSLDDVVAATAAVDEVISSVLAEKQDEEDRRRADGESGPINVWLPGEEGGIYSDLTGRAEMAALLDHATIRQVAETATGGCQAPVRTAAWVSMPGYGHQGLHQDDSGRAGPIGSWQKVRFVVVLSPHGPESGTIRVIPGSHRTPPAFGDWKGSAMPPHPEEVRIEAVPGDVIVYSPNLFKSGTFNGGNEPTKCVLVE